MTITPPDLGREHQQRLDAWRDAHPDSPHHFHSLEALEELKAENERLYRQDVRNRPEECASYPSFMTIGNTHKCNLTCQMCFKQLDDFENMSLPDMGFQRYEALAHEVFPHMRRVAFTVSGDPFLSHSLFEELDLLTTYGVRGSMTTNGMPLARKGLFEHLMPCLETLVISFDGADEPVFNSIRRGASFERVVKNIQRFNEHRDAVPSGTYRPLLHFNHILQWKNVKQLPKLIELAHELNVDRVHVDHVIIHQTLNPGDSLERHKKLTNEMIEEAHLVSERLGMKVRLPEPFQIEPGHRDEPYEPFSDDKLLTQGAEKLNTIAYEGDGSADVDGLLQLVEKIRSEGGDNSHLVHALRQHDSISSTLEWGIPQLGESLIPPRMEKVSGCMYPWRESFLEYNGTVAPCCNEGMKTGRYMGFFDGSKPFREIWNGENYRQLRRSLTSGRSYEFCRHCYLVENVDEASWGMKGSPARFPFRVGAAEPVGQTIPAEHRVTVTEILAEAAGAAGTRLEIRVNGELFADPEARAHPASGGWSFLAGTDHELLLEAPQEVSFRLVGSDQPLDLVVYGYVDAPRG